MSNILYWWDFGRAWILSYIRDWLKPVSSTLAGGIASDMAASRSQLMLENAMLRKQLIILKRQVKRPQLNNADRRWLVFFASRIPNWRQALLIVQPDTLLRWHRDLFRTFWRHRSQAKERKSRISPETIDLIQTMAKDNVLWGAERIRGELLHFTSPPK